MKKKLAYFGVNYFPSKGGVSRTTENLIKNLKDEYDITIYCYKNNIASTYMQGVRTVQFPEIPIKGIGVFLFMCLCALHIMIEGDYDILHVRKIDAAFFLPLFSLRYKRILATSHESPYLRDKWGTIAKKYFMMNERIFIKSKAFLTVISKPLSEYYYKKYSTVVTYVPNGVDLSSQPKVKEAGEILKQNSVEGPFICFGARRIMSTKGCHTMLGALSKIHYSNNIVIAGDLSHTPSYAQDLYLLSKGLKAKFVGYLEKEVLLALILKSDFFIFPSETEGMSIMLLEVASLGVPIIASDIPENTQIFDADELVFFKDKDQNDLADKIKWVMEHKELAKEFAEKARARVNAEYSGDVMTDIYRKLYNNLLAQ